VSLKPGRLVNPGPVTEAGAHDSQVRGHLEQNGRRLAAPTIRGNWDKAVYAGLADGSERLLFAVNAVDEQRCACGAWRWRGYVLRRPPAEALWGTAAGGGSPACSSTATK